MDFFNLTLTPLFMFAVLMGVYVRLYRSGITGNDTHE